MEKTHELTALVKKAQKDSEVFAQLYAQTVSFSYAVARRYLSNQQDIEDVLQTSYLYVLKSLPELREPDSFLSWMRTIVVHECQKCLKSNRKISDLLRRSKEAVAEVEEASDWSELLEQHEKYEEIREIMDSLPSEQRMCAALFYYEGKTVAEIAELLNVPQGTVKSRLYHARKKFEKALKKLSGRDTAFVGVPPIVLLRSYFRFGEKETASVALRKTVWSSLSAHGYAAHGAGTLLSSSLGGAAASAGAAVPTVVKVAAITLTAVTAIGGGVTAVRHMKADSTPTGAAVLTMAEAEAGTTRFVPPETSTALVEYATSVRQPTTALAVAAVTRDGTPPSAKQPTSAIVGSPETARQPVTELATQGQPGTTSARPTAAATTVAQTPPGTGGTTRAAVTQMPTQPATSAPQYQMTGGVLRSYSGSESSVTIPSSIDGQTVTAIGSGAFAQNDSVRSVQIPNGVTQIGQQAFSECTALRTVALPSTLVSIGVGAFDGCVSLTNVTVPNGVQTIGDDAFSNCSSLQQIIVPPSVKSIGDNAFGGCDDVTVRCAEGSTAHSYAVSHGVAYQLVEGLS